MKKLLFYSILIPGIAMAAETSSDAKLEFENAWVRVVRVHYDAHEKTSMHDHPATPTIYVYTTDGGRLKIGHDGEDAVIRPPVKAGGIRFQKGVAERHVVEELDGKASEYVRLELKTTAVDLPEKDVRRAPLDRTPYDGGMVRIERITCQPHQECPASDHAERPAVVVIGREARWVAAKSAPIRNDSDAAMEQVRVEFKSPPANASSAEQSSRDQKDVVYARPNGRPVLLDLHIPEGNGPFPAAILVHGGGFDQGSKSTNVRPLFEPLEHAGFAWFSIDYRMAPEFRFVQAKEDLNSAIKWVKANAARYHVDASKIVLIGESAGGFLVNYAGTHETGETRVAAVVDIYGPVDYGKLAELRRDHPERFNMASINRHAANGGGIHFFGAEKLDEAGLKKLHGISPIFAVHHGMAPFLCIHGNQDDQVVYEQSPAMCEAMSKVGASCKLITIEGGGHGMAGWKAPEMQHWKPEMIDWLKQTMNIR